MDQTKIDRINYLARKAKADGLSEEEKIEREQLRNEYRAAFRNNLRGTLENTVIQRPDGTREKVHKIEKAEC